MSAQPLRPSEYAAQPPRAGKQARWIPAGETVEIAGFRVPGGMIYVGSSLPGRYGNANCLIDPKLAVSVGGSDRSASTVPYWPSYEQLRPEARRAYLEWLASGRTAQDIGIGYVFLFFYGLERRLFLDRSLDEGPTIVAEVERLLGIYGHPSFRGYSRRLLEAYDAIRHDETRPALAPKLGNGYEIPANVLRYLGRRVQADGWLGSDDALLWALAAPQYSLRTPGVRCFEQLVPLWRARFVERYPDGLKVAAPKSRLKLTYRAASSNFEVDLPIGDVPSLANVTAPLRGLHALLDACVEELAPFSRLVGKSSDALGTLEAAALLPDALQQEEAAAPLREARTALDALMAAEPMAHVSLERVCTILKIPAEPDSGASSRIRKAANVLDRLDIGFEPDRRYGSLAANDQKDIVLFRRPKGCPVDAERPVYAAARTMVEISAMAVMSDGVASPAELDAFTRELQAMDGLDDDDRLRLAAYAAALFRTPPKQQAAFARLEKLPEAERLQASQTAIAAVLADGQILPGEVAYLERLHKALGLPKEMLYAALHRGVPGDQPVSVSAARIAPGVAIPEEPADRQIRVTIDPNRLARIQAETAVVSSLLSDIFVEESPATPAPAPTAPQSSSQYPGLDASHGALLEAVLEAGGLDRGAFEDEARKLRLLPDGAIETINDWGFDHFDEPILDGEDTVSVQVHLRDQLERMGVPV